MAELSLSLEGPALNPHSDGSSQSVSVCLSVSPSYTHAHLHIIYTHSSCLAQILNSELLFVCLQDQDVTACLSDSRWNPPRAAASRSWTQGCAPSVHRESGQGATKVPVILGVRGRDCRAWRGLLRHQCVYLGAGQTADSLSWVRMWTLLGICGFNQTFQK